MRLTPHGYQDEGVDSIFTFFEETPVGNPLVAMPTGTGKSVVIASFLEQVYQRYRNQKIMVLTHAKELINQNYNKLLNLWPQAPAGVYSAGLKRREIYNNVTFAGIGSVVNRASSFGAVDLLIIDEAHMVNFANKTMYFKFIMGLLAINRNLRIVGLTATPWRMGLGSLTDGGLFTHTCFDITGMEAFNRLIVEGYLSLLIPKPTDTYLDLDGVAMRGDEFVSGDLQLAVDQESITRAALTEAMDYAQNRKRWLIFTTGIEHSINVSNMLNDEFKVSCGVIHSGNKKHKMSGKQRDDTIEAHKAGKLIALANPNILTTGYDDPQIDFIIVLRPTGSVILWVQMLGRGTRALYAPGYDISNYEQRMEAIYQGGKENCLVLDFGRNTPRLGPINDPVLPRKKGEKKGVAPVKECEKCKTWIHASLRVCPHCGAKFVFKSKLLQSAGEEDIIKSETPIVENFKIDHITYADHNKMGKPPTLKVTYFSGLRKFTDFVCIEHGGGARKRAERWWKERCTISLPETTEEGLQSCSKLNSPTHLRVWTNKRYPEVIAYCYDGTNFGKEDDSFDRPMVDNYALVKTKKDLDDFDDDIPF